MTEGQVLTAPLYLPAAAYVAPARVAYVMTTANTAIAVLLADPAIKAILNEEVRGFEMRIGNDALRPHLGNFSPRSLVQFGVFEAKDLDRVDARLRALPSKAAR